MPRKPRMTLEERRIRRVERLAKRNAALPPEQKEPTRLPQIDADVHVPKIMTADITIFPPKLRLAIEHYLDTNPRDKDLAAKHAGMDPVEFKKHCHSPGVCEYIHKQELAIDDAMALARAQARALHAVFLDENLVTAVKISAAKGDTDALALGYERIGLRRDKNFMTQQQASPQSRPQIYRVLEQTVTQTVTQREITAETPAAQISAPQQLERASSVEILDY